MKISILKRSLAVLATALVAFAAAASAQVQSGNVFATVLDEQGSPLPGVTVTVSGGGAPQVQVTDAQGQVRFLGLSPGAYAVSAALEGFSTLDYPNVVVNVNRNTIIELKMSAAVEETITVTAETPLLDPRKIQTGATVDKTELEKIPTARDPWVILQSTPGVLTDRINVGGNESGQQSNYVGIGSDTDQSAWAIDGVEITDIGALGSSPGYYDFDAFEEIQVTTGGSDASNRVPGVGMNLVTKRGTNEWRGSARYLVGKDSWQSSLNIDEGQLSKAGPWNGNRAQGPFKQGNRIVNVEDYGAELGGPIVKDRLWLWGSYGKNQIDLLTISDFSDDTTLETYNVKLNAQLSQSNSATAFITNNDKIKTGRNAGPTRPQPTTWNQSGYQDTPTAWKIEDTHIFSSSFFLTGMYTEVNGGFQLAPQGGMSVNTSLDSDFIWGGSFLLYQTARPQEQYKVDGSYFFTTGSVNHELKFGASYREGTVESLSRWPGFAIDYNFYQYYGYPYNVAALHRDFFAAYEVEYTNGYIQDTISVGNLTANFGLRYDQQGGRNLPSTVRANPLFPSILPSVTYPGGDIGFEWKDILPRLGVTYALGQEKKTLLRASYARFANQLGGGTAFWLNPLYPPTYFYYTYDDRNGDGKAQPSEVLGPCDYCGSAGNPRPYNATFNPVNPNQPVYSALVDPDLESPLTDELLLSVEHAIVPEFVVGLNLSYRKISGILDADLLVFDAPDPFGANVINSTGRLHRRSDYVANPFTMTLPNGQVVVRNRYDLRSGVTSRGGSYLNNSDREQEFRGVSLVFNKRLSNRWMMRGNFTWSDSEWKVPGSEVIDPTYEPSAALSPTGLTGGPSPRDGDVVLTCVGTGSGAKGNVCINSEWSYSVNGLYQVAPDAAWGFNLGASLYGRQGYPQAYVRRHAGGRPNIPGPFVWGITSEPDQFRLDDVHMLDLRVEKELTFGDVGVTLGVDCFNVFNEGYVLQRRLRYGTATGDHVFEVTSPRIFRLGAKFSFR